MSSVPPARSILSSGQVRTDLVLGHLRSTWSVNLVEWNHRADLAEQQDGDRGRLKRARCSTGAPLGPVGERAARRSPVARRATDRSGARKTGRDGPLLAYLLREDGRRILQRAASSAPLRVAG